MFICIVLIENKKGDIKMSSQLTTTDVSTEIINNASSFAEFLASDTIAPIRKTITIIPNVIKDILDVGLEHKQLRIQDRNLRRKAELAKQFLELQDINSQRQYRVELERIRATSDVSIAEINRDRDTTLSQIKSTERQRLAEIRSNEKVKIAELKVQYEIEMQRINNQREMFNEALHESNKRFNNQIKIVQETQEELSKVIDAIMKNVMSGNATDYQRQLLNNLLKLKVQALDNTFDISEGFLDMFSRRD